MVGRAQRRRAAASAAAIALLPAMGMGCGQHRYYQVTSTPTGAIVYEMQGRHIVKKLGTTPLATSRPSSVFAKIAADVGPDSTWGDFSFLFWPLSVPLAALSEAADFMLPPWGPMTYGAELNGQFLSKPSTVETVPASTTDSMPRTRVSFDFSETR